MLKPVPMAGAPLLLLFLTACGGTPRPQPATPPEPLPDTPVARAERCGAQVAEDPDNAVAQRCWRDALIRLRRLPEAVESLSQAREATPDDARRWYFEVRARMGVDLKAAMRVARACHQRLGDVPDCILADALAQEEAGDTARALVFAQKANGDRPTATSQALLARLRIRLDDLSGAAEAAAAGLRLDPEHPAVHLALARVALARRDLVQAKAHLERGFALAPDAAGPLVVRARLNLIRNRGAAAMDDLRAAVAHDPRHARARDVLANMLIDSGQYPAAIEHLNLLVDHHPQAPHYMVRLGEALLQTGNAERALGWADMALGLDDDDLRAATLRMRALIRTGRHADVAAMRSSVFTGRGAAKRRIRIAQEWAKAGAPGRAESAFAEAAAEHPADPAVWRAYADWCVRRDRLGRAGTLLRKGIEAAPDNADLHAELSAVLEKADRREDARRAMAEAARLAPNDPDHPDELARLEFKDNRVKQAIERWEGVLTRHPRADRARLRLSQAYRAVGELDKARVLLENLAENHPKDATLLGHLGRVLLMSKRKAEAVPVLRRALNNGGDDRALRPLLATALADTGKLGQARDEFQSAIKASPENRALRMTYARFLERTGDAEAAGQLYRAQLAREPEDTDARTRLEALGLGLNRHPSGWPAAEADPVLRALAARAPTTGAGGATVLRDERYVRVDDDGVARIRHVRSVLVRQADGVRRHRQARISFHASGEPKIVRARTLTPDGAVVEVPVADRVIANPHAGTPMYGDGRALILRFPQVEAGAIIDYEVVTPDPRPDLKGIWWDGYLLGNPEPTLEVRYVLDLPQGVEAQVSAPGMAAPEVRTSSTRRVLSWQRSDLPGYDFSQTSAVPAVYVSNLRRWADVDRWYDRLFASQAASNDAIRARAQAVTKGLPDRRAKVAAIYQFVEGHVEYLGIEFGIGAYQPRPASATLSRGKGDCKDMTALMVAMLDAVGIKGYPALVRPRDQGGFVADHASPGQFSHVLLYVPDKKGDLWLDATSGLSTLTAIPASLRGQRSLVVDGKGGRIKTIPTGRARQHQLRQTTTYTLTPTGGGTLAIELSMTGDPAGLARRRLLAVDPARRTPLLSAPGYLLGGARVPDRVGFEGLDAPRDPLTVTAEQTDPDLVALRRDGALVLKHHFDVVPDSPLVTTPPSTWFETPRQFERRTVLKAPPGYRFDWKPLRYRSTAGPVQIEVSERRAGQRAEIVTRLRVRRGRLSDAERAKLLVELRRAEGALEMKLAILPGKDFDPITVLGTVAAERPDDLRVQLDYARRLLDADRLKEARTVIRRANQLAPEHPAAVALLAAVSVRMRDFARAEVPLRQLIERTDASAAVYGTLATVLLEQSKADAAVEALTAGIKRFPGEIELRRHRLLALRKAGRTDEALVDAKRMLLRDPEDPMLYAMVGDLAADLGQTAEAETAYRAALTLNPEYGRIMNNLAWLLRDDAAHRAEAIVLVRKAIKLRPEGSAAWDTLAELLFRNGDYRGALKAIKAAQKNAGNDRDKALYRTRQLKYEKARTGK